MKKKKLIAALFALFLGGIAIAQSQEQPSTLTQLQADMLLAQKGVLVRTQYESYAIDNQTDSLLPDRC